MTVEKKNKQFYYYIIVGLFFVILYVIYFNYLSLKSGDSIINNIVNNSIGFFISGDEKNKMVGNDLIVSSKEQTIKNLLNDSRIQQMVDNSVEIKFEPNDVGKENPFKQK